MLQKQQRTVVDSGQTCSKTPAQPFAVRFGFDDFFGFFPVHPKWRIGKHVIKLLFFQTVHCKSIAKLDVAGVLPFDQHVRLTDGVRFGIDFLTEYFEFCFGVEFFDILLTDGQHTACSTGRVIQRFDNAFLGKNVLIFDKKHVDHQANDFPWCKVFSCCFVGLFRKSSDKVFKDISHFHGIHVGQVNLLKGLHHSEKDIRFRVVQTVNLVVKIEVLNDFPGTG